LNSDLKNLVIRIILSVITAFIVFSTTSYLVAVPVYLAVPLMVSFLVTFIIADRKVSLIASLLITSLGSLIFSIPPARMGGFTPDSIITNIIASRQAYLLSFTPPLLVGILGGALGWGIASILSEKKKAMSYVTYFLLILICINFVWVSLDLNPSSILMAWEEPAPGQYNNYNSLNLKTFYLMKHGVGFYQAYSLAYAEKADTPGMTPGNLWNWRLPTVFYLWNWLLPKDGFYIFYLYLIICIMMLWFSYSIASVYLEPPLGLVAPLSVVPLFVYGAAGFWYTFPEYWGVFFLMAALWGIFKNNLPLIAVGFILALITRSFFLIPWFGIMLFALIKKEKKEIPAYILPASVFLFAFLAHYSKVMGMSGAEVSPPGEWVRGNFQHFFATIRFSSVLLSGHLISLSLIIVMAIITTVIMRHDEKIRMLAGSAFLPMILFMFVGPDTERAYWGIIYLPVLILLASLGLTVLGKKEKAET
jgi:hypothetical protein